MRRHAGPLSLALVAALLAVATLFAASVERVPFSSGRPFDEDLTPGTAYALESYPDPQPLRVADLVVAYGVTGILVLAVILYLRRNAAREGAPRRRGGRWPAVVLAFTIVAITAAIFIYEVAPFADDEELESDEGADTATGAGLRREPAEYRAIDELFGTGQEGPARGAGPSVFLIAGLLAAVAAGVAVPTVVWLVRRRPRNADEEAADEILAPVRAAVTELRLGRDPRGVVERCYRQMLGALAERSRVDPACLTPREFVDALAKVGLDGAAISQLSGLFEQVHYGHRPEEGLTGEALRCMTAITTVYPAPEVAS